MEMDKLIEKLKEEFPEKAIDISESLGLLKETINDSIETIGSRINRSVNNRNFENVELYTSMAKEVDRYEKEIDQIIGMLEIEDIDISDELEEEVERKNIPNYDDYVVDSKVEHTLYENFTHIRPAAFRINDYKIIQVKTWKSMLLRTCEFLMTIDEKKFISFEHNDEMNGKKNKYFSTNREEIRKGKRINGNIYIETNLSGNSIRNLIIKFLKEYGFKVSEYRVYFRADYSGLND
ncbi:hypothetical protein [Clostridium sp. DL1XJH146]